MTKICSDSIYNILLFSFSSFIFDYLTTTLFYDCSLLLTNTSHLMIATKSKEKNKTITTSNIIRWSDPAKSITRKKYEPPVSKVPSSQHHLFLYDCYRRRPPPAAADLFNDIQLLLHNNRQIYTIL